MKVRKLNENNVSDYMDNLEEKARRAKKLDEKQF
jgi:hypothetical protein